MWLQFTTEAVVLLTLFAHNCLLLWREMNWQGIISCLNLSAVVHCNDALRPFHDLIDCGSMSMHEAPCKQVSNGHAHTRTHAHTHTQWLVMRKTKLSPKEGIHALVTSATVKSVQVHAPIPFILKRGNTLSTHLKGDREIKSSRYTKWLELSRLSLGQNHTIVSPFTDLVQDNQSQKWNNGSVQILIQFSRTNWQKIIAF
jgi:hypothetical protein